MPNFLDAPEILPLPSLQAYSSISFLFLSCALYYAFQVASDPSWMMNIIDLEALNDTIYSLTELNDTETSLRHNYLTSFFQNSSTAILDQLLENQQLNRLLNVAYIMVHEPLCVWTLINMGYCLLILFGKVIQKLVFGDLRASEQQLLKDKFWNFLFYKFIFVFSVINVQFMDELILWCAWFSILGFMFLLTYLCKERFSYLTFSPAVSKWDHWRLMSLLVLIFVSTMPLLVVAIVVGMHTNFSIGIFLLSECLLLMLRTLYCIILYVVHLCDLRRESIWEKRNAILYYIEFIFDLLLLSIDLAHHLHMLIWSNIILSVSSLVIIVQVRGIFNELYSRIKRHQNYLHVLNLMEENFPIATSEEINQNDGDCAICWDHMDSGRKLPCNHFFHTTCLRSWLEQETSCPTCRHSLRTPETSGPSDQAEGRAGLEHGRVDARGHFRFFQFEGQRYARWLPTFSVEVTRPRFNEVNINASLTRNEIHPDFGQQQIEYMGQQVLEWFPQFTLSSILEDLRITRSVEHTIENILEGRLRQSTTSFQSSTSVQSSSTNEPSIEDPKSCEEEVERETSEVFNDPTTSGQENTPLTTTEIGGQIIPKLDELNSTDSEEELDDDIADVDSSRFLQLSSDERSSILQRRKNRMFGKAKKKYLKKSLTK